MPGQRGAVGAACHSKRTWRRHTRKSSRFRVTGLGRQTNRGKQREHDPLAAMFAAAASGRRFEQGPFEGLGDVGNSTFSAAEWPPGGDGLDVPHRAHDCEIQSDKLPSILLPGGDHSVPRRRAAASETACLAALPDGSR